MNEIEEVEIGDIYLFDNEIKSIILKITKNCSYNVYTLETTDRYDCVSFYKDEFYKSRIYSDTIKNPKYYKKIGKNFETFKMIEIKDQLGIKE